MSWATIAERHGLSTRRCQNIHREEPFELEGMDDPVALAAEAMAQIGAIVEDAASLAEETANDAVRLGAINTRLKALVDKIALQRAFGLLPRSLGLVKQEVDIRQTSQATSRSSMKSDCPGSK